MNDTTDTTTDTEYRTFDDYVAEIPRYDSFYSVGEHRDRDETLANSYEHVDFEVHGTSSDDNEIWSLTIGDGRYTAFFFAAPHPNEPIGCMTIDFLAQTLAKDTQLRDSLDYEFVFMKFADIDGSLLNQGWFDGPFTLSNYAQNFYRPASYEQVEWTFPMDYKDYTFDESLPETEILMEIIETHQPDFIYSLHNAGFGGCYYYISEECSEIFDDLRQISRDQDVPLDLGEPEAPWMEEFDDAIYQMPSSEMNYDYLEENTDDSPAEVLTTGAGSYDYAREHNAEVVELVTELPYFYDEQIESDTKTDRTRREIVLEGIEKEAALVNFLEDQYDRIADDLPDTRFKRAIADIIDNFHDRIEAKRNWAKTDDELDENATVAQTVDALTIRLFYRMLYLGTFMRAIDQRTMQASESVDVDQLIDAKQQIEDRFHELNGMLLENLDYEAIPIWKLVAIQSQAGLICLDYLQKSDYFEDE